MNLRQELYEATKDQPSFNVEDFRRLNLHEDMHPNAIGQFFQSLSKGKLIEMCGFTRVTHEQGNKRWVFKWKWNNSLIGSVKE